MSEEPQSTSGPKTIERFDLSRIAAVWVEKAFAFVRRLPVAKWLDTADSFAKTASTWAVAFFGALFFIASVVIACRSHTGRVVFFGIGGVFASFVALFCGPRMIAATKTVVENSKGRISSIALLDSLAAINFAAAIACFVMGVCMVFRMDGDASAMFVSAVSLAIAGIAMLVPELVAVEVGGSCTPAQELLSLVVFLLKVAMRLVPYAWIAIIVYSGCAMLFSLGSYELFFRFSAITATMPLLLFMPLVAYLAYLVANGVVDILQAILAIPSRQER